MKNDVHWIDSIKRLGLAHICVSIREAAIHFECQNKLEKKYLNSTQLNNSKCGTPNGTV